jgi:hypothetical protein
MNQRAALILWAALSALLLLVGVAGGGEDGAEAGVILAAPFVFASVLLCQRLDRNRGAQLAAIFLYALVARWVVAAIVHLVIYKMPDQRGLFAPDDLQYDFNARLLAEHWMGHVADPSETLGVHVNGTMTAIAVIYYLFGYVPLAPRLFYGIIGAWTAVVTAMLAGRFFSKEVARRAGLVAALVPSLALWASVITKDTPALLGVEVALYAFLSLRERLTLASGALFAFALLLIATARPYELVFVAVPVVGTALFGGQRFRLRNVILFVAMTASAIWLIRATGSLDLIDSSEMTTVERVNEIRAGYASGADSAVNLDLVDTSSAGGLALWAPIGLAYFYLAPVPFSGGSIRQIMTSPEMLLWYAVLPAVVRGLRTALREKIAGISVLLLYAAVSSVGWALVVTNVGTIYRYRAQILFVPILLMAFDQIRRRERRRRSATAPTPFGARQTVGVAGS